MFQVGWVDDVCFFANAFCWCWCCFRWVGCPRRRRWTAMGLRKNCPTWVSFCQGDQSDHLNHLKNVSIKSWSPFCQGYESDHQHLNHHYFNLPLFNMINYFQGQSFLSENVWVKMIITFYAVTPLNISEWKLHFCCDSPTTFWREEVEEIRQYFKTQVR